MKAILLISILLPAFTGCVHRFSGQPPPSAITKSEAIAIVRANLEIGGADPKGIEYSAEWVDGRATQVKLREDLGKDDIPIRMFDGWLVNAKYIFYDASGAKRSVPGGFTDYFLDGDGKILKVRTGR